MQDRILNASNTKVLWNTTVIDVIGSERIESLLLENVVTKERSKLDVKGLFIAIGHSPATKFLKGSGIELDESGYVKLRQRNSYTNIEGVFAAGDVADSVYRQAVSAAGMGCVAALDCERWLAAKGVH
jgi:thioredoxin reductase (NADPH)